MKLQKIFKENIEVADVLFYQWEVIHEIQIF